MVNKATKRAARWNRRMAQWDDRHPGWLLRVSERKLKKSARRVVVKCGDCDRSVEIYIDRWSIEINGVCASRNEWQRVLGSELRKA